MKAIYKQAKKELECQGVDFSKNVYSLTGNQEKLLEQAAKKYGYRVTSDGNSALGCILHARFFVLLQKVASPEKQSNE